MRIADCLEISVSLLLTDPVDCRMMSFRWFLGECASIYVDESTISQSVEDIHRVSTLYVWVIDKLGCQNRKILPNLT